MSTHEGALGSEDWWPLETKEPFRYSCHLCPEGAPGFESIRTIKMHMQVKHGFSSWSCFDPCWWAFATPEELSQHNRDVHQAGQTFHCELCRFLTTDGDIALKHHVFNVHEQPLFQTIPAADRQASALDQTPAGTRTMVEYFGTAHETGAGSTSLGTKVACVQCPYCTPAARKDFVSIGSLRCHYRFKHELTYHCVRDCQSSSLTEFELRSHAEYAHGESLGALYVRKARKDQPHSTVPSSNDSAAELFTCTHCSINLESYFASILGLRKHHGAVHGLTRHCGHNCTFSCDSKQQLIQHYLNQHGYDQT